MEVGQICRFMGLKGISNGVLRFRDVKVPRENLLWGEGLGLKLALITLNTGRLALPAFCAAAGKGLLRACRKWANERVQWGAPIGKHDAVAQMLGRMAAETYAMEAAVELAAAMSGQGDAGHPTRSGHGQAVAQREGVGSGQRCRANPGGTRLRNGRLPEAAGRGSVPGRTGAAGRAHQHDLRRVERDHASVHRPRGGPTST